MKCIFCDEEARAICKFCGCAICSIHRKTKVFLSGFGKKTRSAIFDSGSNSGVRVNDASWCGKCDVEYEKTF